MIESEEVKKIKHLFLFFYFAIFVIVIRLFYLQIFESEIFFHLGQRNFLRIEILNSPRGNIVDCNNKLLATNKPVFDLYWSGKGHRNFATEQKELLSKLAGLLEIEDREKFIYKIEKVERNGRNLRLKENLPFDLICKISEQFSVYPQLVILQHFERFYPNQNLASHILGYLGSEDKDYVGRYGIEKLSQGELKGECGYELNIISACGKKILNKEIKEAKSGSDIKLTLDLELQKIAESLFDPSQAGTFILLDANSGAIKVLVSYPNFDPNLFLNIISKENWDEKFSQNSPLLNRATNALYPPASIFKLVTFTTGLEEGIINFDTRFNCKGYSKFGGRKYYCIRHWGHGELSLHQAIAHSCNIPCFEIAKNIKIDQLANYAFKFGLGNKTNFVLPDKNGLVPTYSWKIATKKEPWWPGETLSACIGQSYLLVTPLQIARMLGGICSRHLAKPYILDNDSTQSEKLLLKDSTFEFLRSSMKDAVNFGTASSLKHLEDLGFSIYAKTGTAQTSSLKKAHINKNMLEHGWFGSFFYYKDQNPLVLVVIVEHTGRSGPAIDIAGKFLSNYSMLMEQKEE